MSNSGYDDSHLIGSIESLMRDEPGLSRRAAIIRIAGEENLRRLEKKLSARSSSAATTPFLLEVKRPPPALLTALSANGDEGHSRLLDAEFEVLSRFGEEPLWNGFSSPRERRENATSAAYREAYEATPASVREHAYAERDAGLLKAIALIVAAMSCFLLTAVAGGSGLITSPYQLALIFLVSFCGGGYLVCRALKLIRTLAGITPVPFAPPETGDHAERYVLTPQALYVLQDGIHTVRCRRRPLDATAVAKPMSGRAAVIESAGWSEKLACIVDLGDLADALERGRRMAA